MKVAIFGSYNQKKNIFSLTFSREAFEDACFQIGNRLVKDGHQLIIGSDAKYTADYHFFMGAFEYLKNQDVEKHYIEILRPNDNRKPFIEFFDLKPEIFKFHSQSQNWWQGSHLLSINECDVILTVGGGRNTYGIGLAAIFSRKRIFPIGSFGGASSKLIEELPKFIQDYSNDFAFLNNPWSNNTLDRLINISEVNNPPKILIIHGRSNHNIILKDLLISQLQIPDSNIKIMAQQDSFGKSLPEKFEKLANSVNCAIALATPDDYGYYKSSSSRDKKLRARQNVWLEVGWFWGRLNRNKVMLLCQNTIEIPSDLFGLEYFQYQESPKERLTEIAKFINSVY